MHNNVHLSWVWAQLDSASDIRLTFLQLGVQAPGYNEPLAALAYGSKPLVGSCFIGCVSNVIAACLVLPALSLSG